MKKSSLVSLLVSLLVPLAVVALLGCGGIETEEGDLESVDGVEQGELESVDSVEQKVMVKPPISGSLDDCYEVCYAVCILLGSRGSDVHKGCVWRCFMDHC